MKMIIGCHLSASKGYLAMAKEAVSIGANTFQFFSRNPRGGSVKPFNADDAAAYNSFAAEHGIGPIIAHAPYTLNPCAADDGLRDFARGAMADDLSRLEHIDNCFYNFHPGSHTGRGPDEGIRLIIETLNSVLKPEEHTVVLLETMAGKGSEVGGCFEELRRIIDGTKLKDRVGVCMDTCHIFDGGYDIVNCLDAVIEEFDKVIGLDRLKFIHINDSKNVMGSRKDRHEKIGEGNISLEAFGRIVNHPALRDLPFCLETPNELDGYAAEIKLLRTLRTEA